MNKEVNQFRISPKCTVTIEYFGDVTQEAIKVLIELLQITAKVYPPDRTAIESILVDSKIDASASMYLNHLTPPEPP